MNDDRMNIPTIPICPPKKDTIIIRPTGCSNNKNYIAWNDIKNKPFQNIDKTFFSVDTSGNITLSKDLNNNINYLNITVNEIKADSNIQPDWNQNDETKKDYIKNRTHWVEEKAVLEETTFTIEESDGMCALGNFPVALSAGDICNVVYDGEVYTDTPQVSEDSASIDFGEFSVYFQNQPDGLCAITIYSGPGEHTISILQKVYHPIPDEYIPNWVASVDDIIQSDWDQNNETAKDYIKGRPGGYYDEITTTTLTIDAIKQDESDKLTDVQVIEDNLRYGHEDSINVAIDCSSGIIQRTLTKRYIPGYTISEFSATIYGNAHLVHESQPDTGEDLAMYKDDFGDSTYGIGWHIWAPSVSSGMLELSVIKTEWGPIPFPSDFIPWETSPTANSVLYTAQSLTDIQEEQARANIGAGTPYTLPQATAEALGGVKADSAEAADTQPVRIGGDGKLYTTPGITDISTKMDANNPVGIGSFSMNRKARTKVGDYSHAEGYNTTASGRYSHAEGVQTTAIGAHSHVQGKFNIEDTSNIYADIIGNGRSDTARSNAATVDWEGNAWFAGDVYTGSTSGTNKDDGSKKLATEEYVNNSIAASGGTYYVELDGSFPNYTLSETTPLADIAAAYNDGKALFCRCSMGNYTATLPLFVPATELNTWIFSGSGGAAAMNMPAQYFTIVVSSQGVTAEDKGLVQTDAIVTSVSASSTDNQVPSAKCVYDLLGNVTALIDAM